MSEPEVEPGEFISDAALLREEIARLCAELKAALAFLTSDPETLHSECDCQIERLRTENTALQTALKEELDDEIARLQAALTEALEQRYEVWDCTCVGCPSCAPHVCRNGAGRCESCTTYALQRRVEVLSTLLADAQHPAGMPNEGDIQYWYEERDAALRGGRTT